MSNAHAQDGGGGGGRDGEKRGKDGRGEEKAYREGFRDGQRHAIERGQRLSGENYRVLDPDNFVNHYGRELGNDYRYVETVDGTRLLIEVATGIIAEILGAPPPRTSSPRPPRRDVSTPRATTRPRDRAGYGIRIDRRDSSRLRAPATSVFHGVPCWWAAERSSAASHLLASALMGTAS